MYFPIFVDLTDREILVVGGGTVASRRIRVLTGFCEHITVVAPEVSGEIARSISSEPGGCRLTVFQRSFEPSDLDGRHLVLAATDDAGLNRRIAEMCRAKGIPVNDCSDRRFCDFQFPSVVRDEDVVIGINASGKNHRLVKETRKRIERCLGVGNSR